MHGVRELVWTPPSIRLDFGLALISTKKVENVSHTSINDFPTATCKQDISAVFTKERRNTMNLPFMSISQFLRGEIIRKIGWVIAFTYIGMGQEVLKARFFENCIGVPYTRAVIPSASD